VKTVKETHEEHPVKPKGHESEGNPLLKFDPGVGIWALITFILLFFLLKKFAWGPIINSIDEREKRLQSSLKSAEEARNESKRIAEQQKEILSQTREEASEILSTARHSAEELKHKIETSAKAEKEKILGSAVSEIEAMKDSAIRELRNASVDLAIGATEKLLQENLDKDNSRKLVDKYIDELESEG
jgi:F-type H+-transporting ATPase subunit b